MDPGSVNFAWALRVSGKVTEVGWIEPIVNVTDDTAFLNDCIEVILRTNPDYIVLERFMVRRGGESILAESVNQMIGRIAVLSVMWGGLDLIQVTPASWKNWWTARGVDWHKVYEDVESIHQRDACGIAEYIDHHWIDQNVK